MTKFEMYFSYRRNIIALYGNKKIKKKLYLFKILDAIFMISIEPIKKVDTFEKALFNYQYYKAMAEDAENDKLNHKDEEHILVCKKQEDYYISQREIALEYVLDFINYSGVKAYFVKIRRKELKNKLFEIVLENNDNSIMHSVSEETLNKLKEKGCFIDEVRESLVQDYINKIY